MDTFSNKSGLSQMAWIIIGVIVIALIVLAIPLLSGEEAAPELGLDTSPTPMEDGATPDLVQEVEQEATEDGQTTLEAILSNPDPYVGQQVTVRGEVSQRLNDQAFVLADPNPLGDGLLVVGATIPEMDENILADEDMIVEATGQVRILNLTELQEEMDFQFEGAELEDWEDDPIMVAGNIQIIQEE